MDDQKSDQQPDQLPPSAEPVAPSAAEQEERLRARRRRFIRLGASAVPVSLTLSSRPVMAWHCYTTSAWGSQRAEGVKAGTSVYNRLEANKGTTRIEGDECWYITNWKNNTGRTDYTGRYAKKPWVYVGRQMTTLGSGKGDNDYANYAKANLKVVHVFPGGLFGHGGDSKCWDIISNGVDTYADYCLIAGLNRKYAEAAHKQVMDKCLKPNNFTGPDQLDLMAKLGPLGYKPPGANDAWDLEAVRTYLSASYLAV